MSQEPKVSVLMPVYNGETYLPTAIDSVLSQTLTDLELIVINDGSTDRSEFLLEKFQKQDSRIRLISRGNTGIVPALNEGLSHARGQYIARMDADDIAMPERFAQQVEFLDSHPEHVAVGSRTLMIDPEGLPIKVHNDLLTHEEIDQAYLNGGFGTITHPAVMLRHETMQTIGGYRKEMDLAEDDDLFLRLAEIGKLANLPQVLLKYRQHLKSFSSTKFSKGLQVAITALQEAYQRRGLKLSDMPYIKVDKPRSLNGTHSLWAWWALGDGNVATARKHAFLALKSAPTSKESWKTFACAVRGW